MVRLKNFSHRSVQVSRYVKGTQKNSSQLETPSLLRFYVGFKSRLVCTVHIRRAKVTTTLVTCIVLWSSN